MIRAHLRWGAEATRREEKQKVCGVAHGVLFIYEACSIYVDVVVGCLYKGKEVAAYVRHEGVLKKTGALLGHTDLFLEGVARDE
jgi:hypothetical protein